MEAGELEYPDVWKDDEDRVHVRCDSGGERAVSQQVGAGGPLDVLSFIRELADVAGLEIDDSQDADGGGPVTISVPPGA